MSTLGVPILVSEGQGRSEEKEGNSRVFLLSRRLQRGREGTVLYTGGGVWYESGTRKTKKSLLVCPVRTLRDPVGPEDTRPGVE